MNTKFVNDKRLTREYKRIQMSCIILYAGKKRVYRQQSNKINFITHFKIITNLRPQKPLDFLITHTVPSPYLFIHVHSSTRNYKTIRRIIYRQRKQSETLKKRSVFVCEWKRKREKSTQTKLQKSTAFIHSFHYDANFQLFSYFFLREVSVLLYSVSDLVNYVI